MRLSKEEGGEGLRLRLNRLGFFLILRLSQWFVDWIVPGARRRGSFGEGETLSGNTRSRSSLSLFVPFVFLFSISPVTFRVSQVFVFLDGIIMLRGWCERNPNLVWTKPRRLVRGRRFSEWTVVIDTGQCTVCVTMCDPLRSYFYSIPGPYIVMSTTVEPVQ